MINSDRGEKPHEPHGLHNKAAQPGLVTEVRATPAPPSAHPLLYWVSCTVAGQLRVDGLTVRRSHGRRLLVSFPSRRDRNGRERPYIRPLSEATRRSIESQILRALDLDQEPGP